MDQLIKNKISARVNTSMLPTNRSEVTNQSIRSVLNDSRKIYNRKGISKFPSLEGIKMKHEATKDLQKQNILQGFEENPPMIYSNGRKIKMFNARYRNSKNEL